MKSSTVFFASKNTQNRTATAVYDNIDNNLAAVESSLVGMSSIDTPNLVYVATPQTLSNKTFSSQITVAGTLSTTSTIFCSSTNLGATYQSSVYTFPNTSGTLALT